MFLSKFFFQNLPMTPNEQYAAHFVIGLVVFLTLNRRPRLAIVVCFSLAVGKELIDYFSYGRFDMWDLFFTLLPLVFFLLKKRPHVLEKV